MSSVKMIVNSAKPFIKWAGGKSQLLSEIEGLIPLEFKLSSFTYIEPFVGGGAFLFWLLQRFPQIESAIINDINSDLINSYKIIKKNVDELISVLKELETEYHVLADNQIKRKEYYYSKRDLFNKRISDDITQAALFIFLNKTCFNGLYRVNAKNEFNVPIGSYNKPLICDENNLRAVNKLLERVTILNEDFEQTLKYANGNALFYLDPPYKPLSETSSFNSYTEFNFNDNEQKRLAKFCEKVDALGFLWILSNSDVKGKNPDDNFFDDLYKNFIIKRVYARRSINANPLKRGELTELLITNIQLNSKEEIIIGKNRSTYKASTA